MSAQAIADGLGRTRASVVTMLKKAKLQLSQAGQPVAWTTDDAIAPSNLAGFYCYASGEGAGWLRTGTFDPDERGSTMGQLPPYTSVLDLYLMAHDAAGRQLSFLTPIAVVLGQSG